MKWGLTSAELQILFTLLVDPLKANGARVWIFGSRARGDHKRFSDIDVLYEAPNGIPKGFLGRVIEQLENSNLKFKVDLVGINDLAVTYRSQILSERQAL